MKFHKRIILDFDDTLAFPTNRDWENARANHMLILKINELYDQGWRIDIFTARGSISCKTRAEADAKYRKQMEAWLKRAQVKYHSISFEKPLAAYYIDDKGMTPEAFIDMDIKTLEGGLSGSDIYTDGKMVHKQDSRAHQVSGWYNIAKWHLNTPLVDRIVGDTITMQYITHDENYFTNNTAIALGLIQDSLNKMSKISTPSDGLTFSSYRERIRSHVEASNVASFKPFLYMLDSFELDRTFSHGDFGVTNMLFTKDHKLFLIDPIPDVFGCTQLDVAKFIASLYINEYHHDTIDTAFNVLAAYNGINRVTLRTLVASEIIRVYKYHPNKQFIMECVDDVFK